MADWQDRARVAVWAAAYSDDPEAFPVYQVPKPKPWWAFWRPTEWETVTGMSRAQLDRHTKVMGTYYRSQRGQ